MSNRSRLLVDLFAGAGGLSEGLKQAGFTPVLGLDFDKHAIGTYAANNPSAVAVCKDVKDLSRDEILEAASGREIDLIAGGPSCQGFSTHGKRLEDDPRNFLFREFVRIVREVQPKFFVMENVRGMLTYGRGAFRRDIENAFRRAGYRVTSGVVCAADFGVPQLRHRILFVGTRLDVEPTLPAPTHSAENDAELFPLQRHVSVEEAIGDLPRMNGMFERDEWEYAMPPQSDFQRYVRKALDLNSVVTLHQANGLSPQAREIAALVQQGQGLRSVPVSQLPERFRRMRTISTGELRKDCTTLYHRLDPHRPSYTITTYFRNIASGPFLHPWENRSLSIREAARLQSFPDKYRFVGASIPRQIGNAVPVLMARAIGECVLSALDQTEPKPKVAKISAASRPRMVVAR